MSYGPPIRIQRCSMIEQMTVSPKLYIYRHGWGRALQMVQERKAALRRADSCPRRQLPSWLRCWDHDEVNWAIIGVIFLAVASSVISLRMKRVIPSAAIRRRSRQSSPFIPYFAKLIPMN